MGEGRPGSFQYEVYSFFDADPRDFNNLVVPLPIPVPQAFANCDRLCETLVSFCVCAVDLLPRRQQKDALVAAELFDMYFDLSQSYGSLERKERQGITNTPIKEHEIVLDR